MEANKHWFSACRDSATVKSTPRGLLAPVVSVRRKMASGSPTVFFFFQFYFHLSLPSFCLFVLLPPILSHSVMPFISGIITFSFDPHTPSPFLLSFNVYNRLSPLLIFTTFSCNKSGLPFSSHSPYFTFHDNPFDLINNVAACNQGHFVTCWQWEQN